MSANSKIFKGPGPIQVPRLSSDPASGVNGEIYYNTSTDKFKVFENGSWINSSPADAANKDLSNLTNPTAVNQHLLPATDDTKTLGLVGQRWSNIFSAIVTGNDVRVKDPASAFFVSLTVPSLAADTSYVLPAADGSSGQVLSTDGAGILSWASAGSGANTALSNLAAVAINVGLTFDSAIPGFLKTANGALAVPSENLDLASGDQSGTATSGSVFLGSGTAVSANSGAATLRSGDTNADSGNVFVRTGSGLNSGDILIEGGSGTSTSGNIELSVGSSAGTRGQIKLSSAEAQLLGDGTVSQPLSFQTANNANYIKFRAANSGVTDQDYTLPLADGSAGQQLTTDGAGILSWAASGGGANTALSNLAAVAINASLVPDSNNAYTVGSPAFNWAQVFSAFVRAAGQGLGIATTSADNATADTTGQDMSFTTDIVGISANVNGGGFLFNSAAATGTGTSGLFSVQTGGAVNAASGSISLLTGDVSGSGAVGGINIKTGNANGTGGVGDLVLAGGTGSLTAVGGNVSIQAGGDGGAGSGYIQLYNYTPAFTEVNADGPRTEILGKVIHVGASNLKIVVDQFEPQTLLAATGPVAITQYKWIGGTFPSVEIKYVMFEQNTGKVRRGTLISVENGLTPSDIAYNDVVEVENAGFPAVTLDVVYNSPDIEIHYTNAGSDNVYIQSQVTAYPASNNPL